VALTVAQQRATAVSGGCWPYGFDQPAPTRTPYVRYGTATPSPTPPPAGVVYPTCTPAPLTPTVTPKPTVTLTPRPPRTPVPASVVGGPVEVGNQAGGAWFRTLAIHPVRHTIAVAWIANGSTFDDSQDGQVWVKVQRADQTWNPLQTVNVGFIGKASYAGLAMTIGYDGAVYVVYGEGRADNRQVQLVESHDDGLTWSLPTALDGVEAAAAPPEDFPDAPTAIPTLGPTPTVDPAAAARPTATPESVDGTAANGSGESQSGAVIALAADPSGGLHLLYRLGGIGGKQIGYAYRAPGETFWRLSTPFDGTMQYRATLGLLLQSDGRAKRFVAIQTENAITLYTSRDGVAWDSSTLPVAQYLATETIFTMTMAVAPRGAGLVAVTWGQYARGGVFAAVSLDGGVTWGQEERIAQHNADGRAFENQGEGNPRSGFDPWVVYDAITDQLAVSWVEMDRDPKPRTFTTMYAIRALTDVTVPLWRYGISPETADTERPPTLGPIGFRSQLYGTMDGAAHVLLGVDPANAQQRVYVQPLELPGLLKDAES
jgi:hypothetical protein